MFSFGVINGILIPDFLGFYSNVYREVPGGHSRGENTMAAIDSVQPALVERLYE